MGNDGIYSLLWVMLRIHIINRTRFPFLRVPLLRAKKSGSSEGSFEDCFFLRVPPFKGVYQGFLSEFL